MSFSIPFNTSSIIKFTKPITATVLIPSEYLIVTGRGTSSISTSVSDGASWVYQSNSIFTTAGRDIAVNNNIFLAVGEGTNTIATSVDGTTWIGQPASTQNFTVAGHKAMWDGTKWILAGQGTNTLLYGTGGPTWSVATNPLTTAAYGLLYDSVASKYFAVGNGTTHTLATSADGISWTGAGKSLVTGNAYTIHGPAASTATDPSYAWIAVGNVAGGGGNIIGANTTIASWSGLLGTSSAHTSRYAIGYGNGIWISGGLTVSSGNNYSISSDGGANWSLKKNLGNGHVFTAKYANGLWLMGGWGNANRHIQRSTDNGASWSDCSAGAMSASQPKIFNNDCWSIEYGNGIWMAGGDSGGTTIIKSTDGNIWAASDASFSNVYSIAYANGYWVAAGSGGIRYSTDNGVSWNPGMTSTNRRAVAYGNGYWICLGTDTSVNSIQYTSNPSATTWSKPTSRPAYITNTITDPMGLATNGSGTWVGCIGSRVIKSTDISNWSVEVNMGTARQVAFRANKKPKYVVGGTGNYLMMGSDDGTTWYEITDQPFSIAVNDVKWNGSMWLAGGEGNWRLAYSTNGSNWIGITQTVITTRVNKVHWNSRLSRWYAVGEGTNRLAISGAADGLTWSAISTPVDISGIGIISK